MTYQQSRFRRSALLCGAAMAVAIAATPALAQEQIATIDIPAQPMDLALKELARQSGANLLFSLETVKGLQSRPVQTSATPEAAARMLLAGTDLSVVKDSTGSLIVQRAADPQSGSAAGDGADGTVQALIVTAQKREEDIQDVPIAISAFTQEDLTRSQIAGGPDLMTQVPNFTFTKTNFSGYSIQIRGIGTQAISATTDPAVAVAFNNTPFIRNRFFEQEFYDLERVEVLRGPQGTLYGRNATAGVVNIISAKPKDHFEAELSADVSNYNSSRLEGMINIPLVDGKAGLRLAGAWTKRDGFVKNILTGDQTDGRDLWSARVTLGIEPNDRFKANLIYEHFEENDDRLRSGKQLCHKDPGPSEINGTPTHPGPAGLDPYAIGSYSQGCKPASLYSPDSFDTPNGYSLAYYAAASALGAPVYANLDPYVHSTQSRNLREIETHIKPDYEASTDTVELQLQFKLTPNLTLASETGFNHDYIFSFEDYNRFDTTPGVFIPGGRQTRPRYDIIDQNGVFCDPQLGCTNRLAAGDLSTAKSLQFSQEFRLSSDYDGPFNFSLGANFLRYDTEEKYYVFINSLTVFVAGAAGPFDPNDVWAPGVSDNSYCFENDSNRSDLPGYAWSNPNHGGGVGGCTYIDPNDIHHLNDEGRNYFLSKNPYHLLSYAAFGEAYYQITPELTLTGGFRWTVDRKSAPQIPSWLLAGSSYGLPTRKVIEQEWREPTGRLSLDWKPELSFTDQTLLYVSYTHGYKAGGANPPPPIPIFAPVANQPTDAIIKASLAHPETFEPEFVNAFEVGTKNTLLDGMLTFNLNAFYYDYTGYQISEIVDRSALNLNFDARIWGAELEADWRPLQNLRLGFKGGYENTRLAKGSEAIDLTDRTAGNPDYILKKPFPTFPSNCIVPVGIAFFADCQFFFTDAYDSLNIPNNGEGIEQDLSGNALPNAPHFTATLTADYTLPLGEAWLATLHGDFYYQSEAWTRVFNQEGYDKLKAYNNVNFALIFTNEDAGWKVMAYVKNAFDRDSITGAFLNSDDSGLTTNVFLTEPRLYGLRLTKQFDRSGPLGRWFGADHKPGAPYPLRVELGGYYGRFSEVHELLAPPTTALFPAAHPYPLDIQRNLHRGTGGEARFTYRPAALDGWSLSAEVRYGRASGDGSANTKWTTPGGYQTYKYHAGKTDGNSYIDPTARGLYNYATTTSGNEESHAVVDFDVGKDVGLGGWSLGGTSTLSLGLRYAHFKSSSNAVLHGRPDLYFPPDNIVKYGGHMHRFHAAMDAAREFEGAGPALSWDGALRLVGSPEGAGRINLDLGAGGAVLWGKQNVSIKGDRRGSYEAGLYQLEKYGGPRHVVSSYNTPIDIRRSKRVTVPTFNANMGLSYDLGRMTIKGGYRWERYFKAVDGGIDARKTYDRTIDGPYFKVSVGFGG